MCVRTLQSECPSYMWKRPCMHTHVFPFSSPNTSRPAWPWTETHQIKNNDYGKWKRLQMPLGDEGTTSSFSRVVKNHPWAAFWGRHWCEWNAKVEYLCSEGIQGCQNRRKSPDTWGYQPTSPVQSRRWWPPGGGASSETSANQLSSGIHHDWKQNHREERAVQ